MEGFHFVQLQFLKGSDEVKNTLAIAITKKMVCSKPEVAVAGLSDEPDGREDSVWLFPVAVELAADSVSDIK